MSAGEASATWDDIVAAVADEVEDRENAEAEVAEARGMIDDIRILDWTEIPAHERNRPLKWRGHRIHKY